MLRASCEWSERAEPDVSFDGDLFVQRVDPSFPLPLGEEVGYTEVHSRTQDGIQKVKSTSDSIRYVEEMPVTASALSTKDVGAEVRSVGTCTSTYILNDFQLIKELHNHSRAFTKLTVHI